MVVIAEFLLTLERYKNSVHGIIMDLKRYGRSESAREIESKIAYFYQRSATDALANELNAVVEWFEREGRCKLDVEVAAARSAFHQKVTDVAREIAILQHQLDPGHDYGIVQPLVEAFPSHQHVYFHDHQELQDAVEFLEPFREELNRLIQIELEQQEAEEIITPPSTP
jgi:hypothetical protein